MCNALAAPLVNTKFPSTNLLFLLCSSITLWEHGCRTSSSILVSLEKSYQIGTIKEINKSKGNKSGFFFQNMYISNKALNTIRGLQVILQW